MKNSSYFIPYSVITLVFLLGVILSFYNLSYAGYYSDKIINWIWLFATLYLFIKLWKTKAIRIYCISLITFLLLTIIPIGIPFFGIIYYFTTIDDYQKFTLNNEYRIERTKPWALSPTEIQLFQRKGILEKRIYSTYVGNIFQEDTKKSKLDNLEFWEQRSLSDTLSIQHAKLIFANRCNIGIEYQLLKTKKLIVHNICENLK